METLHSLTTSLGNVCTKVGQMAPSFELDLSFWEKVPGPNFLAAAERGVLSAGELILGSTTLFATLLCYGAEKLTKSTSALVDHSVDFNLGCRVWGNGVLNGLRVFPAAAAFAGTPLLILWDQFTQGMQLINYLPPTVG